VHFEPGSPAEPSLPPRPGTARCDAALAGWPIRSAPSPPSSAPTGRRSPSAPSRPRRSGAAEATALAAAGATAVAWLARGVARPSARPRAVIGRDAGEATPVHVEALCVDCAVQ
jgi:hypothetical protein